LDAARPNRAASVGCCRTAASDIVALHCFRGRGTAEEQVLPLVDEKINMFGLVVGEACAILGALEVNAATNAAIRRSTRGDSARMGRVLAAGT
jgi:hypothetical protein